MLRRICLVALCMVPVALCYSTAAPAPAKGSNQLSIVPAQSQIVVQLHGVDRVRDRIKAISLAPDRRTIKLAAATPEVMASATVTISAKMGGGILSAHGLPAPPDGHRRFRHGATPAGRRIPAA